MDCIAEIELSFGAVMYEANEQEPEGLALEVRRGVVSSEILIPFLVCVTRGSAQCKYITSIHILLQSDSTSLSFTSHSVQRFQWKLFRD